MLNPVHLPMLFISGAAFIIAQMLAAYRLALLLRMINLHLSYFHIFKLTMIGSFFNIVIPGAVGGDIVKGAYLFRSEEDRRGRSSGIVLMDRVMGVLALLFIGAISVCYLYLFNGAMLLPYISQLKWVFLISTAILIIFVLSVLLGKKRPFQLKVKAIVSTLFKETMFFNITDAIGTLIERSRELTKAFCISLGVHAIILTGLLALIRLVPGDLPDIAVLTAVSSLVLLFGIIPVTPGNIGWTELVASIGWSIVGTAMGGVIFLYWRIVNILFSLPGGLLYLLPSNDIYQKKAQTVVQAETIQK